MYFIRNFYKTPKLPNVYIQYLNASQMVGATIQSGAVVYDRDDPGPIFMDSQVQHWLKSITRLKLETVFRKRSVKDNTMNFKFMTTIEIKAEVERALEQATRFLQMPPVVQVKADSGLSTPILSSDSALAGFSDSDYVFTDITFGVKDSRRLIIRRSSSDGSLKTVSQEVSKRMNQMYFPIFGRQIRIPKMLEQPDNFKLCLEDGHIEFLLDKLCVQFEPYEVLYQQLTSQAYLYIEENKKFNDLRSSRHFGPMAFFLAWHNKIDNLLMDMIKRDYLKDAVELVALTCKVNKLEVPRPELLLKLQDNSIEEDVTHYHGFLGNSENGNHVIKLIKNSVGKSETQLIIDCQCVEVLKEFVEKYCLKKVQLQLAIQMQEEGLEEKLKIVRNISKAHGLVEQ